MKKIFLFLLPLMFVSVAKADENLFGYVTGADTLPKGAWEVYQWVTLRSQKAAGTYEALDTRTEFEHGITDRFSASLYLNFRQVHTHDAAPHDENMQPAWENRKTNLNWQGGQMAFKYNFISPYTNTVGFSVYVEPGYSRIFKITGENQDEFSLEAKIIFQVNMMDDQLIWAFNLSPEHEVRKIQNDAPEWAKELALEATTGLSYRFMPNWFGALEARYHSEYPDYGKREHYAVFVGPTLHYGAEKWWFTVTWLPQLFGGPAGHHEGPGNLHLSEHEKNEYRLKVGYNF